MRKQIFDEEVVLNCDCQDPRCLVHIVFDNDQKYGAQLIFDFLSCEPRFWNRIKAAWRILRTGDEDRTANVVLIGFDNLRDLKAFCERCLSREAK